MSLTRRSTRGRSRPSSCERPPSGRGSLAVQLHIQDGINHIIARDICPEDAGYTPAKAATAWDQIEAAYVTSDRIVGELVAACADAETVVCVVSDHGALPTFRQCLVSGALARAGLMTYARDPQSGRWNVDWTRTQVFPRRGHLWVNLKGRDPQGIVEPDAYEAVREQAIGALLGLWDEARKTRPILVAVRKEDAVSFGQWGDKVGDIITFMAPLYADSDADYASLPSDPLTTPDVGPTDLGCAHHPYLPSASYGIWSNPAVFFLAGPVPHHPGRCGPDPVPSPRPRSAGPVRGQDRHRRAGAPTGPARIGGGHRKVDDPSGFPDQRIPMHVLEGVGDLYGLLRGESEYIRYDRAIAQMSARWIREEATAEAKPWCLFVGFITPHFPLVVPDAYWNLYPPDALPLPVQYGPEHWSCHPVLELKRRQEATDHGEMLGEHGLWWKSAMYESAVAVPLIVAGPDVPAGRVMGITAMLVDVFPAIVQSGRAWRPRTGISQANRSGHSPARPTGRGPPSASTTRSSRRAASS